MTIGIIYVGFQCEDLIQKSLTPWIEARSTRLGGVDWKIAAVSVPFEGFDHSDMLPDITGAMLSAHQYKNEIDHLIMGNTPMKETEARGAALTWLVGEGEVDYLLQWDSDEQVTEDEILRLVFYIQANKWFNWFRISYQNLVFTDKLRLKEPFTPPRIHKVRVNYEGKDFVATGFYEDNNVYYAPTDNPNAFIMDKQLSSITIPETIISPLHYSWINNLRSKRKSEYQQKRWGPPVGAGCSFAWNEARGGLVWNDEYFRLTGLPIPEVVSLDIKI